MLSVDYYRKDLLDLAIVSKRESRHIVKYGRAKMVEWSKTSDLSTFPVALSFQRLNPVAISDFSDLLWIAVRFRLCPVASSFLAFAMIVHVLYSYLIL